MSPTALAQPATAPTEIPAPHAAWRRMRATFSGPLHRPGDAGYDAARQALNPTLDPRPVLVAEALTARDVQVAVAVAREHDLPFAVQATGHGTHVPCDGGLLLKTSRMAAVVVDPDRRIARVGPGARWSEVIAAAAPFGLAPLSGSAPSVGVAGYTLGGGLGWLSRRFGFAADSLLRAELVTADGRLVTASAARRPDLFWALRGGGGNFGVATRLELRLFPVDQLYGGAAYFPVERAADTLARYREWAPGQPDAMSMVVVLQAAAATAAQPEPVRGRPALVIRGLYAGGADEAERLLRPLRQAAGTPLLDTFRPMRYADAGTIGGVAPRHLDLFTELPDEAVTHLPEAAVTHLPEAAVTHPPEAAVATTDTAAAISAAEVRYWGGAMADPGGDAGPTGHRDAPFSVIVDAPTDRLPARLRRHATGGSFLNFLSDPTRTRTAYTAANYRRLAAIKAAYDPDGTLGLPHRIAAAAVTEAGRSPA